MVSDRALYMNPESAARAGEPVEGPSWSMDALRGRVVELLVDGAGICVSVCVGLVAEAQRGGEPAAWVTATDGLFHPGDAAAAGVDSGAVPVVRVRQAASVLRACERLLRSGAFGLVILDPGPTPTLAFGALGTIVKLAQAHQAVVVFLTTGIETPLGSLVSLRARTRRVEVAGRYEGIVEVLKDKRSGPNWQARWAFVPPDGLGSPWSWVDDELPSELELEAGAAERTTVEQDEVAAHGAGDLLRDR